MAKSRVWGLLLAFWLAGCSCGELVLGQPSDHPRGRPDGGVAESGMPTDAGHTDGSDGGSLRGPHSGSRIKVRGFRADDAAIPSGVLWDAARGVTCSPTFASDGTERCLPPTGQRAVWFTDANCKNPVIVEQSSDPCAPPEPHPYATVEVLVVCPPSGLTVFAKGSKVSAPTQAYVTSGFGCTAVSGIDASSSFFEAVPSPSSDWVRFRENVTKVTARLGVAYWDGTDGSRVLNGMRLLKEDVACQETTADGNGVPPQPFDPTLVERCAPSNPVSLSSGFFAGDTCQTPVGLTLECSPPGMTVGEVVYPAIDAATPACQSSFYSGGVANLYRAVGVPSPSVYTGSPGQCTPTPYGGFHYYEAGAPLPFGDFPLLTITHAGTGRFQPVYTVSDGHELYMHPLELYDTQASRFCAVGALVSDTRMFCVSFLAIAQYSLSSGPYADPTCTTHLVQVDGSCGAPPPVAAEVTQPAGLCTTTILRKIAGVHASPTYSSGSPFPGAGPCAPEQPGVGVSYDIGGEVDPAALFPLVMPTDL